MHTGASQVPFVLISNDILKEPMSKHTPKKAAGAYVTPMTREGVSQPSDLSPDGSEAHYRRRGGPGTRSKNPYRYDKASPTRAAQ